MKRAICHITHFDNLPRIVTAGGLYCDSEVARQSVNAASIANSDIKRKRQRKVVPVDPGGALTNYVPFYFAPRSPMLCAIHAGSVAGYSGTQAEILHLVSNTEVIQEAGLPFVFTDGHAIMRFTHFYSELADLVKVDWQIMREKYWIDTDEDGDRCRRRQAEFLVHSFFPWRFVAEIGVYSRSWQERVSAVLAESEHRPVVTVRRRWYY